MIKIGICGFGTVGKSFANHLIQYQDKISKNCQRDISLSMICDRSIDKKKFESQTVFDASKMLKSGFVPPYSMPNALKRTIKHEFLR